MKSPFTKSLLIGSSLCLGIGSVITMGIVIIPTQFNSHEARLSELHVGSETNSDNPVIHRDADNAVVSIASDGAIIGYQENKISNSAHASVLGGGARQYTNEIDGGDNAVIAGGKGNIIIAADSVIGAGEGNEIAGRASLIAGGGNNKVYGNFSNVVAGENNTISSNYSVIPGGANNVIDAGANSSVVAGQRGKASHPGTFIWSDQHTTYSEPDIQSAKPNTFLIRANNGMGINTSTPISGVNVVINGSALLGGSTKLLSVEGSCTSGTQGTIEYANKCFYFCDGKYWQVINLPFEGDDMAAKCNHNNAATKTCYFDGFELRAGDTMTGYNALSGNCASARDTVTCQFDGSLDQPDYKYANCFNM